MLTGAWIENGVIAPIVLMIRRRSAEVHKLRLVAISQALEEYVHTHPGQMPMSNGPMDHRAMPMAAPGSQFGPDVTFTLTFQQPGLHQVWGQFSLDGDTFTAPFVLQVAP